MWGRGESQPESKSKLNMNYNKKIELNAKKFLIK